jgi:hypothetical protein
LTAQNLTYQIGTPSPTLTATASPSGGISGSSTCSAYASGDSSYGTPLTISSLSAGTYVIHCTGSSASGYGTPTLVNGTLTVTSQSAWAISATSVSFQTPGTPPVASGSVSPSGGLSGSLSCAFYANADNTYSSALTLSNSTTPGTYVVHCSGSSAAGYASPSNNNGVLTVTQTTWNLTAQNASYTVGGSVPTLTAVANPSGGISGSPTCNAYSASDVLYSTSLTISGLSAGTYVIHCVGSAATGYAAANLINGTLTVTSLSSWTITATSTTFQTPGTAPTAAGSVNPVGGLSGSLSCNFYTDNTYSTVVSLSNSTPAGTYVVHCIGTSAAGYASPSNNDGTLVVSAATFTIAINSSSGGSASSSSSSVASGSSVTLTATPSTGYTFTSWTCTGGGTLNSTTANPATLSNINSNATCTPTFTLSQYTITFNSNYGTPTTSTQTFSHNVGQALDDNPFSQAGYNFLDNQWISSDVIGNSKSKWGIERK